MKNNENQKSIEIKDVYEMLVEIKDAIKDSTKWTKFAGMTEVKPVLELQLDSDVKKIIYDLSDGENSSYDIEKKVGYVTRRTISNYWQKWEKLSIGESSPVQGGNRFKASFSLEDFGIKVPEVKINDKAVLSEEEETTHE